MYPPAVNVEDPTSIKSEKMIVTIDGPAGSGKSTLARQLAQRLGLDFLDTGAMYRAIAAKAIERGIDLAQEPFYVVELARHCPLRFDWQTDPPRLYARGADVTDRLRDADVTSAVSDVAAIGAVRQVLVENQRQIGKEHPRLVTEGRDQGSIVFPDADVKFYLDASPAVRAHRRAEQLRELGKPVHLEDIRQNIIDRDRKDSSRSDGPLICPDDAMRIDTSEMSLGEVLDLLEQHVLANVGMSKAE